jgi:hypothetical protein
VEISGIARDLDVLVVARPHVFLVRVAASIPVSRDEVEVGQLSHDGGRQRPRRHVLVGRSLRRIG